MAALSVWKSESNQLQFFWHEKM